MSVTGEAFDNACEEACSLGRKQAVDAIVDHLRHQAAGYALLRSVKANGARDALYQMAEKLEKAWETIVLPRVTPTSSDTSKENDRG